MLDADEFCPECGAPMVELVSDVFRDVFCLVCDVEFTERGELRWTKDSPYLARLAKEETADAPR